MNSLLAYATTQYGFIKESRNLLFSYCNTFSPQDFVRQHPSFGNGGSVRSILVHVANTYESWIAQRGLNRDIRFTECDKILHMDGVSALFNQVDDYVYAFIKSFEITEPMTEFVKEGVKRQAAGFQLFSHVITHEFHHKGQILSLSRHWGYIPVDTDIIR
jgi:uncharacterized damage-inducible protein DinB